jgi:hypothetical protein
MSERTFTCTQCGAVEHWLTEFPGGICLACHERKMAHVPVTYEMVMAAWGRPVTRVARYRARRNPDPTATRNQRWVVVDTRTNRDYAYYRSRDGARDFAATLNELEGAK